MTQTQPSPQYSDNYLQIIILLMLHNNIIMHAHTEANKMLKNHTPHEHFIWRYT